MKPFRLRHFVIRFWLPLAWKIFPSRRREALQRFSETELDSAWQSLYAIPLVEDPRLKRALFEHALEEMEHAELFRKLAQAHAPYPLPFRYSMRKPILETKEDLVRFLVFLHVGEAEINHDFDAYLAAVPDEDVREVLRKIRSDEEGHSGGSEKAMLSHAAGENLAWLKFRQRATNAYRRYEKFLHGIGETMMGVLLVAVYFLFGLFFYRQAARRMALGRDEQARLFRETHGGK